MCSSVCSSEVEELDERYGYIHTPNYPYNHPSTTHCVWRVTAPVGQRVVVHFEPVWFNVSTK